MQSTLGNLPEFFVVIFALNAGQKVVAETAILGSILVNALLVLGLVIVVGAIAGRTGVMRFGPQPAQRHRDAAADVASFIIVLVGLANLAHDPASHHTKTISIIGAMAMLVVYASGLRQYLRSADQPGRGGRAAAGVNAHGVVLLLRSAASPRRSSRTGSSTRCSPRSTRCTSPKRSPGW